MEIGIGSYAWRWAIGIGDAVPAQPLTPVDLVRRTRAHGLSLLQIADNLPLHLRPQSDVDALGRAARREGVRLELGLGSMSAELVTTYIALAERLNVRVVRIAPDAADARKSAAELAVELREVAPAARRAEVTLAIENHFHLPSPKLVEIIEGVADPTIGVCLDVANSIAVQEWPAETIELLAPYAVNLHLKDYRIAIDRHGVGLSFVGVPLGQGQMDIRSVFAALKRHNRDVSVILEHWLPHGDSAAATLAAEDDWLRQSIAAARAAVTEHTQTPS